MQEDEEGKVMSQYLYVKLGDPMFEQFMQEQFLGFIIEKNGHRMTIGIKDLIKFMHETQAKAMSEELDEQARSDRTNCNSQGRRKKPKTKVSDLR